MSLSPFQKHSLKTRATLFTLFIFLVSNWVVALYASRILREDMQKLLGIQQLSTVFYLAAEANRELNDSLALLGKNAGIVDTEMMSNPSALSEFIAARPVLQNRFVGGVLILGLDGSVLAEYPYADRVGVNYMDVDAIAAALKAGQSTVGSPATEKKSRAPVFTTAVPIRDSQGAVIGALAGVIDLGRPSFLDQIIEKYNGNTGYYLLIDPKARVIVTATGKQRIMEPLPVAGLNPQFDRFAQGGDETGIAIDLPGVEVLSSARRINVSDWYLVSALPTAEAFAPIHNLQQRTLVAAFFLTLLAGLLTWLMLRREMSPMLAAVKTLSALSDTNQPPQPLSIASQNEIGDLIGAFNHLLESLGERENALKNTLRFQQKLMDAVPSPIFYRDTQGVYIGGNKAYEHFVGLSLAALIGKTVHDIWPADVAGKYTNADRALLAKPGFQTYEDVVANADGTRRDVVFNKATYTDFEGTVVGLIGVILDISERKQAEKELHGNVERLTELNRKLEEAQNQLLQSEKMASVGQLAAGVAHEINNPIGFINSNLCSLKGQVQDLLAVLAAYQNAEPALAGHDDLLADIAQAKAKADLEFLQDDMVSLVNESLDGVQRVRKIVDNLKDFSHVDTAEWHFANLEQGLESTLNIVWNEIKYKADVKKEYAGLPDIECIASQLNQVFMNLMVNAAHAIGERGTITLRTGFDDTKVWIDVADTGSGIKPEHLSRIFEPFFTTKPVGKGTGLGLSLAYGIIQRHHGRLEVRSELGNGTVFRVTLPRLRAVEA